VSGEALTAQATKQVTAKIAATGQVGALAASSTGQELGGIYGEAAEGGKQLSGADLARIWGAGAAAGAVETFADKLGLDALSGKIKIPGAGRAGRATVGGVAGAALEGGTEVVQTGLERFGSGKALTGDEAMKDYINSGAMGALPGGAAGMIRGAITPSPARTVTPEQEALNKLSSSATVGDAIQAANELATGTVVGDLHSAIDAFQAAPGVPGPTTPSPLEVITQNGRTYPEPTAPTPAPVGTEGLLAGQLAVQSKLDAQTPGQFAPTVERSPLATPSSATPATPAADLGPGVAAARVQADSGRTLPARAFKETGPDYVDLQPMSPMQAQQRLAVLR
jgi:hypothetical protein